MSLKKLVNVYEKYIISLEHQLEPSPAVQVRITIPGEGNTYVKQVSTLFEGGTSIEEAEKAALDKAIALLTGNKETKPLVEAFENFDISTRQFSSKSPIAPICVKTQIVVFKDQLPYRTVVGLASGTNLMEVEKEALKSAVNKALGK